MKTGLWSNEKKAHLVRWVQIYSFCAIGGRAAPSMHRSYHHIMIWGRFCRSASANWGHLTTWRDRMTRFLYQRIFPRGRCRLWRFKLRLWIQTFTSSLKSFRYAGGDLTQQADHLPPCTFTSSLLCDDVLLSCSVRYYFSAVKFPLCLCWALLIVVEIWPDLSLWGQTHTYTHSAICSRIYSGLQLYY